MVYTTFHQSQIFRYFGLPIYDVGHPKFINQDFRNGKYYWSLKPKIKYDKNLEDFLPIRYYKGKRDISPINVAQVGIGLIDENFDENSFHSIIEWIIQNVRQEDDKNYWLLNYDVPTFNIKAPWKSGLAQGLILSFLIRYCKKFSNNHLKSYIDGTLNSLVHPISMGGCSRKWKDHYIIEEYISDKLIGVLNGHISALLALNDYITYYKSDEDIVQFINDNVKNLYNNIMDWMSEDWSYYNLSNPRLISSIFYQELHIIQMKTILQIQENSNGSAFLHILEGQYKSQWKRFRALRKKRKEVSLGLQNK